MLEWLGAFIKTAGLRLAGGKAMDWGRGVWTQLMFRPRVSLALDWRGLGIYSLDRPNQFWRAVKMTVVAGRDHEFVVAGGTVEARPNSNRAKWIEVASVADLLRVPITVAKNRTTEPYLSGSSIAGAIGNALPGEGEVQLRVRLRDYHRTRVVSEALTVTTAELVREKWV